jgi:hypothetical protein
MIYKDLAILEDILEIFLNWTYFIFKIEVSFMGSFLVVKAKIKDIAQGYNVAGDVADVLEKKVTDLIRQGCERAKANGRKTLMGKDI